MAHEHTEHTGAVDDAALDWNKGDGLLPVVVQDAATLRVLMLGYMNQEALATTRRSGLVTFYSRSKQRLWTKGEGSGHTLELVAIDTDCDYDTLLVLAHPRGPTCHLGRTSCFPQAPGQFLGALDRLVAQREGERPPGSYTTTLFEQGTRRIAQKVGEEGVETALAGVAQGDAELLGESADLLYHLTVLLRARGLALADAVEVLETRHR
ncbi:bifunctional phosphoribosyl-AMP cyclohydrolase/phosphoribosyl-ATP diphosphatase HisIE [Xanthomonas albilineans]|uniref:Histidine biosynthesis bifunctional protein HisIE n=1 Tax=Xanthomonas albilineans (strain GPE PC73 / CFBP 7063) TaxID=380358 RepID=D2UCV5_XANAP|nr:bifunctional phosphoribosyl-AMP cyclohydrolase/phosphoribosyl-ATP diphosphatase HisIE [Xanthomonas albilineans]PPU94895.1 bifunctional phosphoribosyl-AMP cyclohydrolase/phosphoribosyl-ATP diphosphatase HisIE [Xanthomonas albilineans]QHQ27986.1 putative histidine biosynthesis bifunctional protein hisie (bifunctional phosphoribosyl-amp cyclohydrolase/phosphoribosyl-ATP pyrophosphatase protein) [Xanthomonas albilineans]CBA15769.1 probable histidine biosynthesis bifunctional protein hisie (bifunc